MDEFGIEVARLKLGEIVDRARLAEQPTRITRQGKPAAVVVSARWYADAQRFFDAFTDREVIHKDGDPSNNDPGNLEVRESQ